MTNEDHAGVWLTLRPSAYDFWNVLTQSPKASRGLACTPETACRGIAWETGASELLVHRQAALCARDPHPSRLISLPWGQRANKADLSGCLMRQMCSAVGQRSALAQGGHQNNSSEGKRPGVPSQCHAGCVQSPDYELGVLDHEQYAVSDP